MVLRVFSGSETVLWLLDRLTTPSISMKYNKSPLFGLDNTMEEIGSGNYFFKSITRDRNQLNRVQMFS